MKYPKYPQDDRLILTPEIPLGNVLIWKKDTPRKNQGYYTEESISHPAKMHVKLTQWIIKKFTDPGDTIIDPMAGIGTTLLEAATLGRDAVGIEYEKRFIEMCIENAGMFTNCPTLNGKGDIKILHRDARDLVGLLSKQAKGLNIIITSPPYGEIRMDSGPCREGYECIRPYSEEDKITWRTQRDPDNLGNLPHGNITTVIMSPPFSKSPRSGNKDPEKFKKIAEAKHKRDFSKSQNALLPMHYSDDPKNIGNLNYANPRETKGIPKKSYLGEMKKIYLQCFRVIGPRGKAILVTKNFIKNKKVIRLDYDTILLMESCGFKLIDRYFRKITKPSHWVRNYWNKYPDVDRVDHEDILVFSK